MSGFAEERRSGEWRLRIYYDENASSPRHDCDYDTLMVCWHPRYTLGDPSEGYLERVNKVAALKQNIEEWRDRDGLDGAAIEARLNDDYGTVLPLFLFDHGGISISTGRLCRWDSSFVGYFVHEDEGREEYLRAELKEYDDYLRGECFGVRVARIETCEMGHEYEIEEDSCWGFIGDDYEASGLMDYARDMGWLEVSE